MPSFSQRQGFVPVSEVIQVNSMNDQLRNSIWNVLLRYVWDRPGFMSSPSGGGAMEWFSRRLWDEYFKRPVDSRPAYSYPKLEIIRKEFFDSEWYRVYDFIEFVITPDLGLPPNLASELNKTLARENSGYRIVDGVVVGVTSEQEVSMLEGALRDTKFKPVAQHLKRALELLSDRENPDYRNSIKESISAIESMAKIVAGDPKATLADALKALERNGQMHKALKDGFLKLYGYTNDEDGIRHSMLGEPNLTSADAKYFLMSCTSFANYLKAQMPV